MNIAISDQPLPGDAICFTSVDQGEGDITWGTVKLVKWVEAAKGGKTLVYELTDGTIVPAESVSDYKRIIKRPDFSNEAETEKQLCEARQMMANDFVEELFLPSNLKTVISCVIVGDLENLKVARFLLDCEIKKVSAIKNEPQSL